MPNPGTGQREVTKKNETCPFPVPPANPKQACFYPMLESVTEFFPHRKTGPPKQLFHYWKPSLDILQYSYSFFPEKGSGKLSDLPEITQQIKFRWPPSSYLVPKSLPCKHVLIKQTEINRKRPCLSLHAPTEPAAALFSAPCAWVHMAVIYLSEMFRVGEWGSCSHIESQFCFREV